MLTAEENEMLTRVGPGTPVGELLRRYWHPVAIAKEISDENPVKFVRILGEDLPLFRDKKGDVGLLADRIAARRFLTAGSKNAVSLAPITAGSTTRRVTVWRLRRSPPAATSRAP